MKRILALLLIGHVAYIQSVHNIIDHGAVHNKSDTATAFLNSEAFLKAVKTANASRFDREVYVPYGENLHFTFMPFNMSNLHNITFTIEGYVHASEDNNNWPND